MIEVTEKGRKITGWILIVLMILFIFVYHFGLQPKYRYKESANLIEQGKYEDALYMLDLMKEDEEIISRRNECHYHIGLKAFENGDFASCEEHLSSISEDYDIEETLTLSSALNNFQGKWTSKENNLEISGWDLKYYDLDGVAINTDKIDYTSIVCNTDDLTSATFMNENKNTIYLIDNDGLLNVTSNDSLTKYLPGNFTKTQPK